MQSKSKRLIIFFVATFVWTWGFYAPIALGHHSPYEMPWIIFFICGGMGPSLVGVVMTLLLHNKQEQREFWRRCFSPKRIGLRWWGVIFFIFPVIFGVCIAFTQAAGGALPGMDQLKGLLASPLSWPLVAFISFMSGPWSEEFGWRGYALEPILQRLGTIPGTVALGLIWGVWHLPLYFMSATWHAQMGLKPAGFWTFMLFSVGLSLLMTWVYLNTKRSILSGMLMHFGSNFTAQLLAPISDSMEVLRMVLVLAAGVGVCVWFVRRRQVAGVKVQAEAG
jgi:membrane protease YdiL (CAAX protease family)